MSKHADMWFGIIVGLMIMIAVMLAGQAIDERIVDRYGLLPPCETEDSEEDCFWDARSRGNGVGMSFIVYEGHVYLQRCTHEVADAGGICVGEPR